MTVVDQPTMGLAVDVFARWAHGCGSAVEAGDARDAAQHFLPDGYWRDILAFTWDFRTFSGAAEIESGFAEHAATAGVRDFRVAADRMPPRLVKRSGRPVIEGYADFDTDAGRGTAFVRLLLDEERPERSRALLVLTTLQELRGFEEPIGPRRPSGTEYSFAFSGDNWLDKRRRAAAYDDRDPKVLVIGGGQAGLAIGARLRHLGVDTLIVERNARIGDNWRNRYHSLTLHNEVWANHLPYMPFPESWPTFLPKDKLAGWLEYYAEAMELNTWTRTEFTGADYDAATRMWTARLERADGTMREMRVHHIVLASGSVSGPPKMARLPDLDDFQGKVIHSSRFDGGTRYTGARAIVVGTGNSGHDIAQELYSNGAADVTIVQRNPTCVVSLVPSGTMVYALYSEGPAEDIDLITAAIPYPVLRETYQWMTKKTCELDEELLEKLEAAGFETEFGEDGTGFHMKYLREGGGYYINVGCSELIAEGKIRLVHSRDIETCDAAGLRLKDATELPADLIVLATGYENQSESVRRLFGAAVADRVGAIWGFDEQGFMRNMWRRTAQDGFWVMGGGLNECRLFSRFLALQIKADLEDLHPRTRP